MIQANATVEEGHDERKYRVGARLRFVAYNPEETNHAAPGVEFAPGDALVVEPRNGCGMGIDVRREADGALDMVWPEEVELAKEAASW